MSKEVTRAIDPVSLSNPADDAKLHKYNNDEYLRDKSDTPPNMSEFSGLLQRVSITTHFVTMDFWCNRESEGEPCRPVREICTPLQYTCFDLFQCAYSLQTNLLLCFFHLVSSGTKMVLMTMMILVMT